MKKKLSVTIGIPAYNEEANIANLLKSLLKQKSSYVKIEEILVYSDGSTDKTVIRALSVKNKKIVVHKDLHRKGKSYRLNQLFRVATGEVIVVMDADVLPVSKDVIHHLTIPFSDDTSLGMTGGNQKGMKAETLTEEALNNFNEAFNSIRNNWNDGDNVYCSRGGIYAVRKNFARHTHMKNTGYDDNYLYFSCKQSNLKFNFVPKALVWYRNPQSALDQIRQGARYTANIMVLSKFFPLNMVESAYKFPFKFQIEIFLHQIRKNFVAYLWMKCLSVVCYLYRYALAHNYQEIWTEIKSSKVLNRRKGFI